MQPVDPHLPQQGSAAPPVVRSPWPQHRAAPAPCP